MAQDVTVAGASYTGVPAVDLPITGGGTATFYDMSMRNAWMGLEPELWKTWTIENRLCDVGFDGWTASTTAGNLNSAKVLEQVTLDPTNYDYVLEYQYDMPFSYLPGATLKVMPQRGFGDIAFGIIRRPQTITALASRTRAYNTAVNVYASSYYQCYYNSSGTLSCGGALGYGIWAYYSSMAPTLSSTTSTTPTLTINGPVWRARCSTSYFNTARKAEIDSGNTPITTFINLYRVKINTGPNQGLWQTCNDIYLDPFNDALPGAYRQVVGLTFNNDCYFQITGFRLQGSDTVRLKFKASESCNVFGCYTTADATDNYSLYVTTGSGAYLRYGSGAYNSAITAGTTYRENITPTGATGIATSTWTESTFTASVDMCIGTTSTGATSSKLVGTLFGNFMVEGRLRLIPCERIADGVLGYYDTYSETFYPPALGTPTEYIPS